MNHRFLISALLTLGLGTGGCALTVPTAPRALIVASDHGPVTVKARVALLEGRRVLATVAP